MRIRTIRPEFWSSPDVHDLDFFQRLLFIGLWCVANDRGIGECIPVKLAGELFPHEISENPRDTLAMVSMGIQTLENSGLITVYSVSRRTYFLINSWERHQKVDRPSKHPEYPPLPAGMQKSTRVERDTREDDARHHRLEREKEREKEREIYIPPFAENHQTAQQAGQTETTNLVLLNPEPTPPRSRKKYPPEFETFWTTYPRKDDKAPALAAWQKAIKEVSSQQLLEAAQRFAADPNREEQFTPYAATWLNKKRWTNGPLPARNQTRADRLRAGFQAAANIPAIGDTWMDTIREMQNRPDEEPPEILEIMP